MIEFLAGMMIGLTIGHAWMYAVLKKECISGIMTFGTSVFRTKKVEFRDGE